MFKSLNIKFLVLLLAVSLVALSAAFFLRELIIKDFREYREGEMEDRVYWVTADLEGTYEKYGGWKKDVIGEDTVWAYMLGMEVRIVDMDNTVVMDTDRAIKGLSPLTKKRIMSVTNLAALDRSVSFQAYPLFLAGREIGRLEVKFLLPGKEALFIRRSNRFLLLSLFVLGGLSVLLGIIFSRKLTNPIKRLTRAAQAIGEGDLKSRVAFSGKDEISNLSDMFNRMSRTLEIQESLRKKLISNVAHELRTPISAMRGEIEGVMDGLVPLDREQLQSLHEETGRLMKIVEGIEELSRAEASALTLKKQPVELRPFLKNILDRFAITLADKGVTTELVCAEGLVVNADPDRLGQIIINLLSNALRAVDKGGNIWISAGKKSTGVFIEVRDTGCGIKAEDLPFIFERFYRTADGGLGLGLAIVKELVDAHEGRIEAASGPGKGASFIVIFPV